MSNYVIRDTACLFDPATGQWVGVIDSNGAEHVVVPTGGKVVTASTSSGGVVLSVPLPSKKLRPIAQRTNKWVRGGAPDNLSDGVSTGITTQLYHTSNTACYGPRLVFTNTYNVTGAETDGPNDISIKANIRMTGGLNFPVFFNGRRTAICEPGAVLISDPVGIGFKKGDTFYSRTCVSVTSGQKYPLGVKTNSANEGVGSGDLADGSVPTNATRGYGPIAVMGTPASATSSPILITQGDSITCGYGDTNGSSDDYGFVSRAFDGVLGYVNLGLSSSSTSGAITGTGSARRMRIADAITADAALLMYGTNDAAGGDTASILIGNLIKWWLINWQRGLKCFAATIPPQTTSTDVWATTANQTISTGVACRQGLNNWIRDGAPMDWATFTAAAIGGVGVRIGDAGHPITAYFELADAVESARNSGLWLPGYTSDGTHPNATGSAAMAAAIDPLVIGAVLP